MPLVHRLLRRYARNEEQRQEMIGEIYCRFCHLVDAYDPEFGIPLRPYLVRQLSASIHTYARQCWTQAKREKLFHDVFSSDQSDMPNIDPTPEWDRALLLQQIRAALPQALGQLPPRQKQVVIWRYYDGLSYEEIATCLEIHPSTARSLARHGLHKLRAWMQQNRFALA